MRPPSSLAALAAFGLASALAAAPPASAQTPEAKRPRICLVLSGGGARGAAHVGVLKVMEEMRVPIDCIAGTSMGSIVGGAFASGVTVAEMQETLGAMSTERLFKEKPPRQERSIRRKADDFTILFTPEVGFRDGDFQLPKGIVSGIQLETVLRALAKAQGYREFDQLPIPFRAVATDLVSGTPVVFSRGELANVMRASMSVPGLIDPAEIGGKLLVDGGLTDNLPVDVARAMGADIVIAVNLGTPLMKREELNSIFGVTGQMINILTEQNVRTSLASLKPTDILILPELGDFSAGDFDHLLKTIPIGEAAARKVADRLSAFSLPPAEYAALRQRQLAVAPLDLRPVDEIRFPGLTRVNPAVAEAEMETKPGQPIDQKELDRDMQRLYGTDDFEHVNYRIMEETGKRVLSVEALEKSWGPNYLRFGLGLSSDFKGDAYYNLLVSYRKTWLNSLGAEWRTDLQVGRTSRAFTEFYQPLDTRQYFFVAPYADAERRQLAIFNNDQRLAIFNLNYGRLGIDVGSQFTRYGELRLGLLWGQVKASVDTGPTFLEPDPNKVSQGAIRGRLFFDQLDNVNFPRSGYGGTLDIFNSQTALGASVNYTKWTIDGNAAHSFGDHTFNLGLRLGGKIGSDPLPVYDQFNWGGFLQQSGYRTGALLGQSIAFGRLVYLNRLARFTLLPGIYAGLIAGGGPGRHPVHPGEPDGYAVFGGCVPRAGLARSGRSTSATARTDQGFGSFYFYLGRP